MTTQDFLELKIDQIIYHKGAPKKIRALRIDSACNYDLQFYGEQYYDFWIALKDHCSLIPPKEKKTKRYWIWKIKRCGIDSMWCKVDVYLDDNGRLTNGELYSRKWNEFSRVKIEDDFIEAEEE